jgi:hypothetical protein
VNGLLAIAETFLDRMTNLQYGNEINDQYSLRFNQLLLEDREFADSFANLALGPEDISSLPICAWPWYLQWRTERAMPPSPEFLDALFDSTEDPAVRLAVMQSALSDNPDRAPAEPDADGAGDDAHFSSSESGSVPSPAGSFVPGRRDQPVIRSRWLRSRAARLTRGSRPASTFMEADEIVTYLLQLGDPASLRALRSLIDERPDLREALATHFVDAGLDPESAARWWSERGLS